MCFRETSILSLAPYLILTYDGPETGNGFTCPDANTQRDDLLSYYPVSATQYSTIVFKIGFFCRQLLFDGHTEMAKQLSEKVFSTMPITQSLHPSDTVEKMIVYVLRGKLSQTVFHSKFDCFNSLV